MVLFFGLVFPLTQPLEIFLPMPLNVLARFIAIVRSEKQQIITK